MRYTKRKIRRLVNIQMIRHRGLTLIEVMVMIAILGILASFLASKIKSHHDRNHHAKATHIVTIMNACKSVPTR
ncbi:type II secretion system protein [Candidatus Vallotia lariciata]|uniref:type II secretion system protein n=1 Tax=Candidatus Vallotia laricis TaxID=2018052 RepID=UPI003B96894D|nr:hypothetical protein GKR41_00010 [Candidatus Vallotia lariciata]